MISGQLITGSQVLNTLRDFFREKPLIFIGTGISCALDNRFGMPALKDELLSEIKLSHLHSDQQCEWQTVVSNLDKGDDLEKALNSVNNQELLKTIADITSCFISILDEEYGFRIAGGDLSWPAGKMVEKILQGCPQSDPILHIVTPNYDTLLESACDSVGIPYTNGFWGCIKKSIDWEAVSRAMLEQKSVPRGRKLITTFSPRRHIRLYKVHGSLNYFFHNDAIIQNDSWMRHPPADVERVVITPGLSKYQKLQRFRQELLQTADKAIDKTSNFLFLGYGFNDNHLEEYIKRKLSTQSCHGLIITRDSNARIESLINESENLWLVCKLENDSSGSRVLNRQLSNWIEFPGINYWDVRIFTQQILGG